MRDVFSESVVSVPTRPIDYFKILLISIVTIACLGITLFVNRTFIFVALVLGFVLYRKIEGWKKEYEYIHTNDDFDIDLVMGGVRRKHIVSVNLSSVMLIAPVGTEQLEQYSNWPKKDFSNGDKSSDYYAMVYNDSRKKQMLLLSLEPKMHRSLKQWIPDRVK